MDKKIWYIILIKIEIFIYYHVKNNILWLYYKLGWKKKLKQIVKI